MNEKKSRFYTFEEVLKELKLNEADLKKMVSEGEVQAFHHEGGIIFRKDEIDGLKKDQYYYFEDVLNELKLNETELNKMVSEGELKAFQEEDRIKFKKEDIDKLRKSDSGEKQFIEDDTSDITEELSFDNTDVVVPNLDGGQNNADVNDIGSVTTPLTESEETLVDETVSGGGETVVEDFGDTVLEKPKQSAIRASSVSRMKPVSIAPLMAPMVKTKIPLAFTVMLAVIFILLMFTGAFLGDIIRFSADKTNFPKEITREVGQMVVDIFGLKDEKGTQNIDVKQYKP